MGVPLALWLIFGAIVTTVLVIDLGVLHKKAHAVSFKEAGIWSVLWFALAMAFSLIVWRMQGQEKALQFVAGYLLEKSLSVDNMFVFVMIFHYFGIPPSHQSRVLHWGILGAIVMRFFFIFIGVSLIQTFTWMIYVFGAVLIFTGVKMLFQGDESHDMGANPALRLLKRFMPMTEKQEGESFFERRDGKIFATPLFAALLVVEFSDVIFALDSIPAIIAITPDTFIVYTSNIFAILGMRALYFLLSGLAGMFRYLKTGISAILIFVGVKMLAAGYYHVPIGVSLGVIAAVLAASIAASVIRPKAL